MAQPDAPQPALTADFQLRLTLTGERRGRGRVGGEKRGTAAHALSLPLAPIHTSRLLSHLFQHPGHTAGVSAVRWSPDGSRLASCSGDGTARIWDGTTGACLAVLGGGPNSHEGGLNDVAWSPDGVHVATAGDDATARVWGVEAAIEAGRRGAPSPAPVKTLRGHTSYVFAVAFNPRKSELVRGRKMERGLSLSILISALSLTPLSLVHGRSRAPLTRPSASGTPGRARCCT